MSFALFIRASSNAVDPSDSDFVAFVGLETWMNTGCTWSAKHTHQDREINKTKEKNTPKQTNFFFSICSIFGINRQQQM